MNKNFIFDSMVKEKQIEGFKKKREMFQGMTEENDITSKLNYLWACIVQILGKNLLAMFPTNGHKNIILFN